MSKAYRASYTEDMTVVFGRLKVLCNIGEVVQVIPVLTCAEDVSDLVLADDFLQSEKQ